MQMQLAPESENVIEPPKSIKEIKQEEQVSFFETELVELKKWKELILRDAWNEDNDWDWSQEKLMANWWYCNHITGWDNNVPAENLCVPMEYDSVPENEYMANDARDCFISVRRDGVKYDKEFALRRVDRAISDYEKLLEEEKHGSGSTNSSSDTGWKTDSETTNDSDDEETEDAES